MIELLKEQVTSARAWIQNEIELRDQRKRYLFLFLLPILTSFIFVQMQQEQNKPIHYGHIGLLCNSTARGAASLILSLWHFGLRIVGVALGIGLGLGLAGHVYDALSDAQGEDEVGRGAAGRIAWPTGSREKTASNSVAAPNMPRDAARTSPGMEDIHSYHYLMRSAGYSVDHGTLRAQMVRGAQAVRSARANDAKRALMRSRNDLLAQRNLGGGQHPRVSIYKFGEGTMAAGRMKCMWPNLAPAISEALAKLTEFVLRDYVASWYSKVDEQVTYEDPEQSSATNVAGDASSSIGPANYDCDVPAARLTIPSPSDPNSVKPDLISVRSYTDGDEQQFSLAKDLHRHPLDLSSSAPPSMQPQRKLQQQRHRTMVLTTTGTQPSPFVDALYSCFAYLLGMLATRSSENVNVLELLLLHLPHILAQNLRIYREMRNTALEKKRRRVEAERQKWTKKRGTQEGGNWANGGQGGRADGSGLLSQSSLLERSASFKSLGSAPPNNNASPGNAGRGRKEGEVSEIAIVREYLLAGRFHRAVTFGLDVPSLLFADPLAMDCLPGPSYQGNSDCNRLNGHPDEDAILDDRLLSPEATLIDECELDYHRVLASKLSRLTVPKTEVESSIVRTMLVEILASCVLVPVMGCFSPKTINGWIVTGLGLLDGGGDGEAAHNSASTSAGVEDAGNAADESNDQAVNSDSNQGSKVLSSNCSTSLVSEEEDDLLIDSIVDDVMEDIASEGSVTSEMEESVFDMDDETTRQKVLGVGGSSKAEQIITMLSMSIIELGSFVDFEDCRYAREHGQDCTIDWDAQNCRDSVKHLVLVIESALLFGVRLHPKKQLRGDNDRAFSAFEIEATLDHGPDEDEFEVDIDEGLVEPKVTSSVCHHHSSLSAALMDLTGDIDAFEKLVEDEEQEVEDDTSLDDGREAGIFIPKQNEVSTLRTLIAAWLHTGQAFRVLSIIVRAKQTILRRFYHKNAFLRRKNYASDFTRLLRQLDGVDILVDTMSVLTSQCLLVGNGFEIFMKSLQRQTKPHSLHKKQEDPFPEMSGKRSQGIRSNVHSNANSMSVVGSVKANLAQNRDRIARFAQSATEIDLNPFRNPGASTRRPLGANVAYNLYQSNQSTPEYLAFSKNDVFASSLRSERARRHASWMREIKDRKKLDFVCRTNGMKNKDIIMHRELHHLARFLYSNTNEVRIEPCSFGDNEPLSGSAANITVKTVGTRRKIEVPDEDSSFLLRAQPRPLKPVAIQRSNAVACKVYSAMYEEPAIHPRTKRFYGGRYFRQCLMHYYPSDKSACVNVVKKVSVLDGRNQQRKGNWLTDEFQSMRHTCLKVATGGILSSPLMAPGDFCSTPRTGRAIDFAHRVSLFERPLVELGGKKFLVQDASSHRADASSLELSDASMTAAIILRGRAGLNVCDSSRGAFKIKVSDEGMPLVLLRVHRDGSSGISPNTKDEARPYRPSFIRAALLVKSSKQEAQSQCLLHCIKSGSARSSTKVKSDEWLQPTLTLLQYANSRRQEEQSALLRDLRFGINHIDRGQLSRNGLLNPRHPTILRGLNTKVEGVVEVKNSSDFDLLGAPLILFRIRCTAIAEYVGEEGENALATNSEVIAANSRYFREEWTVLRSLRDFGVFHKHIKAQVPPTEHSAGAGAKLVGSVSAALTIVGGATTANERQRGPLVPSLSQATKAGTLGLSTKKVWERRKRLLDQYLKHLVSPNNLLSRCPELLKFLGAYTAVFPVEDSDKIADEYGREDIRRVEVVTEKLKAGIVQVKQSATEANTPDNTTKIQGEDSTSFSKAESVDDNVTVSTAGVTAVTQEEAKSTVTIQNHAARRMARIRAGEIRLKDVRRTIFWLLKQLFDLDNANFFRSRVISVLKTMSVAATSVQDFHLMLFQSHVDYVNGEYISGWIGHLVDMFWPNGVFYTKGPPLTEEEEFNLKQNSKKMIEKMFPDQLRTVLGKHTDEGLDMLHEMLQNRLVLKSMGYMIMDLVWVELFPEISDDFFTGAECLEKEV